MDDSQGQSGASGMLLVHLRLRYASFNLSVVRVNVIEWRAHPVSVLGALRLGPGGLFCFDGLAVHCRTEGMKQLVYYHLGPLYVERFLHYQALQHMACEVRPGSPCCGGVHEEIASSWPLQGCLIFWGSAACL